MEETLWVGTEELLQMHDISYPLFNLRQSTLYRWKGMMLLINLQELAISQRHHQAWIESYPSCIVTLVIAEQESPNESIIIVRIFVKNYIFFF
jgi:hypothetical protein